MLVKSDLFLIICRDYNGHDAKTCGSPPCRAISLDGEFLISENSFAGDQRPGEL